MPLYDALITIALEDQRTISDWVVVAIGNALSEGESIPYSRRERLEAKPSHRLTVRLPASIDAIVDKIPDHNTWILRILERAVTKRRGDRDPP